MSSSSSSVTPKNNTKFIPSDPDVRFPTGSSNIDHIIAVDARTRELLGEPPRQVRIDLDDDDGGAGGAASGDDNGDENNSNNNSSHEFRLSAAIDPEVARTVKLNRGVKSFLSALQTTHITEKIVITERMWFYITILIFIAPVVWTIYVSAGGGGYELPEKLFFDFCVNTSFPDRKYTLEECIRCANYRQFLYAPGAAGHIGHLAVLPKEVIRWQVAAIAYAITVTALAAPVYLRLVLIEGVAMHLFSHSVVVTRTSTLWKFLPLCIFSVLFLLVAIFNIVAQSKITVLYKDIILGYGDFCDPSSPVAYQVLVAKYEPDNPTFAMALPQSFVGMLKALGLVFVPFIPVLRKMHISASSTYSRVTMNHLVRDKKATSNTFENLYWSVDVHDMLRGLEELAPQYKAQQKSLLGVIRHFFLCTWEWRYPLAYTFGFLWGKDEESVRKLCTILKKRGYLKRYRRNVKSLLTEEEKELEKQLAAAEKTERRRAAQQLSPSNSNNNKNGGGGMSLFGLSFPSSLSGSSFSGAGSSPRSAPNSPRSTPESPPSKHNGRAAQFQEPLLLKKRNP